MIKTRRQNVPRVLQGDILRGVEFLESVTEKDGNIEVSKIVFPLVMVLTQDCDLEQDYKFRWSRFPTSNHDKFLLSVLVAPLYNAEHLVNGEHLSDLELTMQTINKKSSAWNSIKNNQTPRFHFLAFPDDVPIVPSVLDFKHYFAANVVTLKRLKAKGFVCNVSPLFREDVSQRFASFLGRIGLPEPK